MSKSEKSITAIYFHESNSYVIQYGTNGFIVNSFDAVVKYMKEQFGINHKTEVQK